MSIEYQTDCADVDWQAVAAILAQVGMGHYAAERHRRAFENSFAVVFAHASGRLVAFGRALCDGAYQAAVYDMAVAPAYQRRGIGRAILGRLLEKIGPCNVILYASPGKEPFYGRQGFRRMKTGMARFLAAADKQAQGFTE